MVYVHAIVNFMTVDAKITSLVTRDDVIANVSPFRRRVEALVQVAIEPEG